MKNSLINQIKTLLGMEVKLEQMKLMDGVSILEAESFEAGSEVFIVTEDEQKIALPIGEYELEDGRLLIVIEEGVISEVKEKEMEVEEPEVEVEVESGKKEEMETEKTAPKKTIESVVKETFFSEIEKLKEENETLKAELSKLKEVKETEVELAIEEEVKPISFNPENENKVEVVKIASKRPRTIMDSVMNKINK
jgi:hypothetical protein